MWIDLLKDEGAQMKSYYYGMFAKNRSGRPQRNLYIPHEWPLQNTLPDMVHKLFSQKYIECIHNTFARASITVTGGGN